MDVLSYKKFKSLALKKELKIGTFKEVYKKYITIIDSYKNKYDFNHFLFNEELIKLQTLSFTEEVERRLLQKISKKENKDKKLLNEKILIKIQKSIELIYIYSYINCYEQLVNLYENTSKLKNFENTQINLLNINKYNNKDFDNYEILRYIYTYLTKDYNNLLNFIYPEHLIKNNDEDCYDLMYSIYWICTKSDALSNEDKKMFYENMSNIWKTVISQSCNNCLCYYLWYRQMKKKFLYLPKIDNTKKYNIFKRFLEWIKIKKN